MCKLARRSVDPPWSLLPMELCEQAEDAQIVPAVNGATPFPGASSSSWNQQVSCLCSFHGEAELPKSKELQKN